MTKAPATILTGPYGSAAPQLQVLDCEDMLNHGVVPPRYRVVQELQRGLTAQVFLVRDAEMERLVVAKFTVDDGREPPPRCEHPLVPLVHDCGIHGIYRWSLQRYVPGTDLERLLRERPQDLSLHDRVRILHQIAGALAAAHAQGIVHLDVKPGNIVLGEHGDCALVDWEAATRIGRQDVHQGTPAYMPPEQLHAEPCDARSDVYALGASLRHVVSGQRPDRPGPWPRGRRYRQLRAIVAVAMATEPERRYQTIDIMAMDLRRWLQGLAPLVAPDPLPIRVLTLLRRHPLVSALLVVIAVTLFGLVALFRQQGTLTQRHWTSIDTIQFDEPLDPQHWQAWVLPFWEGASAEHRPLNGPTAPWRVADGALWAVPDPNWGGCINLSRKIIGHSSLRLRWRVTPLLRGLNCNAYLGFRRDQGYTLHIAGYGQRDSVVLTGPPDITVLASARLPQAIEPGRSYDIEWVYRDQRMQVRIDGELVLNHALLPGLAPVHIPAVGLECGADQHRIDQVHIDGLALPILLNAIQAADLLEAGGHYSSALELLQQLPRDATMLISQARCHYEIGNDAEGDRHLQKVLEQHAGHPVAIALLVQQALERGNTAQAFDYLQRLDDPDPGIANTMLPLLDEALYMDFLRARTFESDTALLEPARRYFDSWHEWLARWSVDLRQRDRIMLPKHIGDVVSVLRACFLIGGFADAIDDLHPALRRQPDVDQNDLYQGPVRDVVRPFPVDLPKLSRHYRDIHQRVRQLSHN
ncbi:MAG: protein kinase domain-containing protein [Planctomycetota bacterium]